MLSHPSEKIRVSLVLDPEERREALAHIDAFMRHRFGCDPPPTSGCIILARAAGHIVGTKVIKSTDDDVPFPIESNYDFDPESAPYDFVRHTMVQGSRWTASRPEVSLRVFSAAAAVALAFGKRHMLIEAKPYAANRLAELGIEHAPLPGATLSLERVRTAVGDAGMGYYLEGPAPTLFMIPLEQAASLVQPIGLC